MMKTAFLTVVLSALIFLVVSDLPAQTYPYPYYYWDGYQYQQYSPQDYDPYYELHVLHYQLYRPQYQAFPLYPPYYQPCCFVGGLVISRPPALMRPEPQVRVPTMRRR
jgi:hypothetical protein